MLYLTTRDKFDTHTAYRALREDRAPNGGFYLPFRMPVFSAEELAQLKNKSFGQSYKITYKFNENTIYIQNNN